jgi:hypothetical protein
LANLRVKTYVDAREALNILRVYCKKRKKGSFELLSIDEIHLPYHILLNKTSIRRGFGLKPRIIEHIYWVNAVTGSIVRSTAIPETEEIRKGKKVNPEMDLEKCKKLSYENALKHAVRFYKSFWIPEVEVIEKALVYLTYWHLTVRYDNQNNDNKEQFLINSYSGEIIDAKKDFFTG